MSNTAAWLEEPKAYPFKIDEAPYPEPKPDEVIIKNKAVAINPIDWKIQAGGPYVQNFPAIIGQDLAGEIVKVGSNVSGFTVGQRVIATSPNLMSGDSRHGAFQHFVAIPASSVAAIPNSLPFTTGAVLPLAISTAAASLYQSEHLQLPYPSATTYSTDKTKTLLVWGGSSSVGSAAVQLATASGITVFTTASPSNFDFVKSLGATQVFDYHNADVVQEIVNALEGTELVGVFDAICYPDTVKNSAEVLKAAKGTGLVVTSNVPPEDSAVDDVTAKFAWSLTIFSGPNADVGKAVWGKFVPEALANGRLQAKPDPLVVGHGLEKIQEGVDKYKAGVSAQKLVIDLA